jgi:hypothetical protein
MLQVLGTVLSVSTLKCETFFALVACVAYDFVVHIAPNN